MKKFSLLLVSLLSIITFTGTAQAGLITNGSFESGLTGWTSSGNVSTANSYTATDGSLFDFTTMLPTVGNSFALIMADQPTSTLTSDIFSVGLGDQISFDWFFSAEDYIPFNDFAGFSIDLVSGGVTVAADILSSVLDVGDYGLTGWNSASILAPVSGDMSLQFYSVNTDDYLLPSALGVDNISTSNAIPEPSSLALLSLGLIGVASIKRKRLAQK